MARLDEHKQDCINDKKLGKPYSHIHCFLDQFSAKYLNGLRPPKERSKLNDGQGDSLHLFYHRLVLHHDAGVGYIKSIFGAEAAHAAEIHIAKDEKVGNWVYSHEVQWQAKVQQLPPKARCWISEDREKIARLGEGFSVYVIGDSDGRMQPQLEKRLSEAGMIILAGNYWDKKDRFQSQNKRLVNYLKDRNLPFIIALEDKRCAIEFPIVICSRSVHLDGGADNVEPGSLVIGAPGEEALVKNENGIYHLQPGYAGDGGKSKPSPSFIEIRFKPGASSLVLLIHKLNRENAVWDSYEA